MSYEGYEVLICEKGHIVHCPDTVFHPYLPLTQPNCQCGASIAHTGEVDETNGLPYTLNFKLVLKTPEVWENCPCCKHSSLKEEATYHFVNVLPYESADGNCIFKE